jgi:mono/diheme cytochrome c family protein
MPTFRYRLSRDQILGLGIYIRSFATKEGGPAVKPAPPPSTVGLKPVQIFRAYCLACHNVDGRGEIVRPGMPDIPDFTLLSADQRTKLWAAKKDAELTEAILRGGKFMPPMKDKLSKDVAEKMVDFVRAFKDGKQVVKLESAELPKQPVKPPPEFFPDKVIPPLKDKVPPTTKSPELAQRLREASVLFRQYCIVCHGPEGAGVPAMRTALPPLPDFTRPIFQEQHSDAQLLISILEGKGSLMPANRGRINEAQARDLVALVRTFAPDWTADTGTRPPSEFQQEFQQLQQQWEALQRQIEALKKKSGS